MISMKEYAQQIGVTYESVRKQVSRYADDLEGHITQRGKTRYLDDEAVAIIESHRRTSPVAAFNDHQRDEIEELRDEVKRLKDALIASQNDVIRLQADREHLIRCEAEYGAMKLLSDKMAADLETASKRIAAMERIADSFKPWLFGLYKRQKDV